MQKKALRQILIAHPVKFASLLISDFLKNEKINSFVIDDLTDFSYLVTDLDPGFIVIHDSLYHDQQSTIDAQLESHPELGVVIIRGQQSITLNKKHLVVDEPFDPSTLYKKLLEFSRE